MSESTPYLTLSRRFVFAASVRPGREGSSPEANRARYGPGAGARHGYGNNYVAHLVFHGPIERATGMAVNIALVRERVRALLDERYEHRFLNLDTPPFGELPPTVENIARQLLAEAAVCCRDLPARPVACHLADSPDNGAIAWADGRVEREVWLEFSAARRTCSPHLSDEENRALFGIAAGMHGHSYRLRAVLAGAFDEGIGTIAPFEDIRGALAALNAELDHRDLNADVPALAGSPITTECLARHAFARLAASLPVERVRLFELPHFAIEHRADGSTTMSVERAFHAAHRLHAPALSDLDNVCLYGACNNPNGHGHRYRVEASVTGRIDARTGTIFDMPALGDALDGVLEPWRWVHLDLDTGDFLDQPSSSENILALAWARLEGRLPGRLERLRLWETENNRFALRRTVS